MPGSGFPRMSFSSLCRCHIRPPPSLLTFQLGNSHNKNKCLHVDLQWPSNSRALWLEVKVVWSAWLWVMHLCFQMWISKVLLDLFLFFIFFLFFFFLLQSAHLVPLSLNLFYFIFWLGVCLKHTLLLVYCLSMHSIPCVFFFPYWSMILFLHVTLLNTLLSWHSFIPWFFVYQFVLLNELANLELVYLLCTFILSGFLCLL